VTSTGPSVPEIIELVDQHLLFLLRVARDVEFSVAAAVVFVEKG